MPPLAAQDVPTGTIVFWSAVLIVTILALFVSLSFYRKWMKADDTTTGPAFTLSDLRRLHREGKMTTEEFEKAKIAIIGTLKSTTPALKDKDKDNPPGPPRRNPLNPGA